MDAPEWLVLAALVGLTAWSPLAGGALAGFLAGLHGFDAASAACAVWVGLLMEIGLMWAAGRWGGAGGGPAAARLPVVRRRVGIVLFFLLGFWCSLMAPIVDLAPVAFEGRSRSLDLPLTRPSPPC